MFTAIDIWRSLLFKRSSCTSFPALPESLIIVFVFVDILLQLAWEGVRDAAVFIIFYEQTLWKCLRLSTIILNTCKGSTLSRISKPPIFSNHYPFIIQVPAAPLVAASAMSAPAALAAAKLVFPSYDEEEVPKPSDEDKQEIGENASFLRYALNVV